MPSSSLIPHGDPTLLFTNAGMNQFKNVFLGVEKRDYKTATSSQKCLRAGGKHNDLENVGFTARHHTFFEMLGNFSFGDYFKAEAIEFAWEYVIKTLGLNPKLLYATVYNDDSEAEKLWKKIAPELGNRVLRFDEKDNFWSMGDTGPCGPCSEIHYDRGEKYSGELNGEGDRFMEIWNLVFMQYDRDSSGKLTPLPRPSVDTGAGLERFCMVLKGAVSNYETDLFIPLIEKVAEISGKEYSIGPDGVSHRVIADHVRALTFAITDGGIISNEGRGYVLRRILRRASRHGRLLGLHEPFIFQIIQPLVEVMGDHYPEIKSKQSHIELVIKTEEEQFGRTLDTGLEIFEDIVKKVRSSGSKIISGDDIFRLYDTYGFPIDLTEVMARERGLAADLEGCEKLLKEQRVRSKQSSSFVADDIKLELPKTHFRYDAEKLETKAIFNADQNVKKFIVLNETPFYAESGGQIGDTGRIYSNNFEFAVEDTQKFGDSTIHLGNFSKANKIPSGNIDMTVTAEIDHSRRADIKRNHTATHLLHRALRIVLGEHVHQAGSLVAPDRFRFDFTHFKSMTPQEIDEVEKIVNQKIKEDLKVTPLVDVPINEAKEMGAMALFGEKYGDKVRVVKTGDFSLELCGGTHVDHTSEIKELFITQESAIAAGMRRIEGITGRGADEFFAEQKKNIVEIKSILKKGIDAISEQDLSRFKELSSATHRRMLHKENLNEPISNFISEIEKKARQEQKKTASSLSNEASNLEPTCALLKGQFVVFNTNADDAKNLMIFADSLRAKYAGKIILTISQKGGNFALFSPNENQGQEIFKEISAVSGARGGGKPTIRGSIPTDKIDAVIEALKKKYE